MKPEDAERQQHEQRAIAEGLATAQEGAGPEETERELDALGDRRVVIASTVPTHHLTSDELDGLFFELIGNRAAADHPAVERNGVSPDRARAGTDRKMAAIDRRREELNDPPGVVTSAESAPRITSQEYAFLLAAHERDIRADRLDREADERDAIAAQTEGDGGDAPQQGREMAAADRASAAEDRQMAAEDRQASLRDHLVGDGNVDVAALERGRAGNRRDRLADQRDRSAGERDQRDHPK
ncbi:MAG: hypothetical protein HQ526_06780 [Actinobacteria bacterium]|nr:hypothetical protein [Actinomycetota bacterium]